MFNQILDAHRRFQLELMAKQNVVGVAVGYRDAHGEATDQLAVIALVEKKVSRESLDPDDLVPRELDGARTDVIEVGILRAQLGSRDRWRPTIPCGVSIGHVQVTAGTLGAMVRDSATGAPLILSNNHVLANCNEANAGDEILQPAKNDGGFVPGDSVARLERFWRIYWTHESNAYVPPPPAPIAPPATPTQPPPTSTQPPPTPTQPIIDPNLGYEDPPPTSTQPPPTSTQPPPTSTQPPPTSTQPPPTSTQPPPTSTQPPPTSTQPPPTSTQPPPTSTQPPPTSTQPTAQDGCFGLIRRFGGRLSDLNTAPTVASAQSLGETLPTVMTSAIRAQSLIPENRVDIALARPLNPAIFRNDILNIGRVMATGAPRLGQQVRKMGRTSGLTSGTITLVNATVDVSYNTPWGTRTARFSGQVITTGMSQGGDSGSLIVDQHSLTAVGLLFGGSGLATIFTPIETVMQYGQFYFG